MSRFRLWNLRGAVVVFEVLTSAAAIIWAWVGVATVTWHGKSIDSVSKMLEQGMATVAPPEGFAAQAMNTLLGPGMQLVKLGLKDFTVIQLTLTMLGAVVLSMVAAMMCLWSLFDWFAYMGSVFGRANSERVAKRAARFHNRSPLDMVVGQLVFCTIAVLLASGLALSFWESSVPGGQLPLSH